MDSPITYFFSQTVNCANYRGKHLHISGYFKILKDKLRKYVATYQQYIKSLDFQNQTEIRYQQQQFFKKLQKLINFHDVNLFGFIHLANNIVTNSATGYQLDFVSEWQRITLEIDIPMECQHFTISIYFKGAGQLFFDHLKVVRQGESLGVANQRIRTGFRCRASRDFNRISNRNHRCNLVEELRSMEKKYDKQDFFTNLSFEEIIGQKKEK